MKQRMRVLYYILVIACYLQLVGSLASAQEGPEGFIYDPKGIRDPMVPLVTPQGLIRGIKSLEVRDDLCLEGIIYDERGISFAIINAQIVGIGDSLDEITIVDIQRDKIIILKNDKREELWLEQEEE